VVGLHLSALVDRGDGASAVASSMRTAHDHGVAATPAWRFGDELVIPGVHNHGSSSNGSSPVSEPGRDDPGPDSDG